MRSARQQQRYDAFKKIPQTLSVSFKTKMLSLPSVLKAATYGRNSSKTVHQDGGVVILGLGQFGTTWDDVNGTYGFETEPIATNLALNSDGAASTYTTSNVTDAGAPIAGFVNSLTIGNNSVQRSATKPIAVTSGTVYMISFYVQMDDGNAPVIGTTNTTGDFSLTLNGAIATTTPLVKKVGASGSLYRISAARTASATATHEAGLTKYTGQSTRTGKITGVQVETGNRMTSYIATTGSTASRAADPLVAGTAAIRNFKLSSYSIFVSCRRDNLIVQNAYALSFTSGTTANRVGMSINTSNVEGWFVDSAGASQVSITGSNPGITTRKRAVSVSLNNFLSSANGSSGTSDNTVNMPVAMSALGIGNQNGVPFNGIIHEVEFYPYELTQTQLNARTA